MEKPEKLHEIYSGTTKNIRRYLKPHNSNWPIQKIIKLDVSTQPFSIYFYIMILLKINKENKQPVFQQIYNQLKHMIEAGIITTGENLPSTRKLAELIGVHRTTVCRAYDELWASGYLETTIGGYSKVRERNMLANKVTISEQVTFNWEGRFSAAANLLNPISNNETRDDKKLIDFRALSPDVDLLPVDDYRHCINQVLKENGSELLEYGNTLGYEPLRVLLAKQMQQHGISSSANEIILTNGIQNGLALILPLLCNPGDCVITESPSYTRGLWLMKLLKLNVVEVPMTLWGMDLEILEKQIKANNTKAIYTMPTFHNPMGISSSQSHREKLLALCEKYEVPLIEDGFEEEMKYFGKAVLPIKSMDKRQIVIYLGTFSKILFPGVRIGWIVASEPLINKLASFKQTTELSGISLTQAAVHKFCEKGFYELHKKRIHRVYRKRMQYTLQACREFIDTTLITHTKPDGGYLMWFTLKIKNISEEEFIKLLYDSGVAVSPGSQFFPGKQTQISFRFSIAHRKEDEIREGIRKIGEVVNKLSKIS